MRKGDIVYFHSKVFYEPFAPYYNEYFGHIFEVARVYRGDRKGHVEVTCITDPSIKVKGMVHDDELLPYAKAGDGDRALKADRKMRRVMGKLTDVPTDAKVFRMKKLLDTDGTYMLNHPLFSAWIYRHRATIIRAVTKQGD